MMQMAVTALAASLNPAIVARQNTGIDSEEVKSLLVSCQHSSSGQARNQVNCAASAMSQSGAHGHTRYAKAPTDLTKPVSRNTHLC